MSKSQAGELGGISKSTPKQEASRKNGLKGGRPPKYPCTACGVAMKPMKAPYRKILQCPKCKGSIDIGQYQSVLQ